MILDLNKSELGKKSAYETQYNPSLLFAIPRKIKRREIGIDDANPGFYGFDLWTHYEVSWLNTKGKPQVAIAEIRYLASSPNIIESKSMKLYFNSFNNTKLGNDQELIDRVVADLSNAVGSLVEFKLIALSEQLDITSYSNSTCLDDLDIECELYEPAPEFLSSETQIVSEQLFSNLLKSNCLITNQPDWGSIYINYHGPKINHVGLLKYIVSLRNHNEFHEQCVERIFKDITTYCVPYELTVYARYTRRGGLDINPLRTSLGSLNLGNHRLIRQ